MSTPLVVVGVGGFGRETLDVVAAVNQHTGRDKYKVLGVVDDLPSVLNLERIERRGIRYLGTVNEWMNAGVEARFVVAIGTPKVRRSVAQHILASGYEAETIVHPTAIIGSFCEVGAGSVICSRVQISTNVSIAESVHLNPGSIVGHDSRLEAFVSINPGAIISGDVRIGEGTLVGAGATVLQGLSVGHDSILGAMACVVSDVANHVIVKGVPAR